MLTPNNPWNESVTINISGCDSGKMRIGIKSLRNTEDHKAKLVSISQLDVSNVLNTVIGFKLKIGH